MKFSSANFHRRRDEFHESATVCRFEMRTRITRPAERTSERAFTMMEIAICLAIISFALVAIIGVLPLGMNTQRDVREATLINQDATVLLEAIRSGGQGASDLTKYVYAITNEATGVGYNSYLTSSRGIVGLLSTPGGDHMVAYVRSMSGLAAEKPPQNNPIMLDDSFSYRVVCVNVPVQVVGNNVLKNNLHELRMTFLWPQRPNGSVGNGRQTFRATIAGQLSQDSDTNLYFYQPQTFK